LSLFEVTVNQTVRGFAEDQYVELHRVLGQIKNQLENIMKRTEVIQLVKDTAKEVSDAITTVVEKEKLEVISKIDAAVANPENTLTTEDGETLKADIRSILAGATTKVDEISEAKANQLPPGQVI